MKHVKPGDSIMSLLSFLDHLASKHKPYKTVSARAVEDTKVIKLPFQAFKIAFEKYPDAYLRVVQIVMIRLQRVRTRCITTSSIPSSTPPPPPSPPPPHLPPPSQVTLLALHQYLGLGAELIAARHRGDKNLK